MNPYSNLDLAACWELGYDEADGDVGMTYDGDPESPRSVAYDEGRTAARVEWKWEPISDAAKAATRGLLESA